MFILKLLSFNNLFTYMIYAIFTIIILFLIYKYIYLEQAVYLITNKLDRLESELLNSSSSSKSCSYSQSPSNQNSNMMKNAEFIMNEIFNMDSSSGSCCPHPPQKEVKKQPEPVEEIVPVIEEPVVVANNLFDLKRTSNEKEVIDDKKKDDDDKGSTISNIVGGGHAIKKNLMKLSIDKLKTKCEERNLPTEGTKNQLADRIIIYDNENPSE